MLEGGKTSFISPVVQIIFLPAHPNLLYLTEEKLVFYFFSILCCLAIVANAFSKMTLLFGSCAFPCYVSEVRVFKMEGNEQFAWIQHTYPESRLQASFINQLADYHFWFLKPPHLNINTYIYTLQLNHCIPIPSRGQTLKY